MGITLSAARKRMCGGKTCKRKETIMKKSMTSVAFQDTPEQKARLDEIIDSLKDTKGALMPIMQQAQDVYGYLPPEVQKYIALRLDIPETEVFGVATFYSQFLLNPMGTHPIAVCLGTACYVKGSGDILDRICEVLNMKSGETSADGRYSIEATRCIGACGLAPVLTINNEVYGRLTKADVDGILAKYR